MSTKKADPSGRFRFADGGRVEKSNGGVGTIYWSMSPGIVAETDLSGNLKSEYVFFDGKRVARREIVGNSSSGKVLVLSAVDNGNSMNYVNQATYGPDSSLTGFVSGGVIANSFSFNPRLQPVTLAAASPTETVLSLTYNFNLGHGDNGNVIGIVNNRDSTRSQSFAYDTLNRLIWAQNAGTDCTQSAANGGTKFWGNSYYYDAWGNLLEKRIQKCAGENLFATADNGNRMHSTGPLDYFYDAAGNMTLDATTGNSYSYDPENRIASAGGFTYTYDADGGRVEKSNGGVGTIYWSMSPGIVAETDLSGNLKSEYVFFDGKRVARKDFPGGAVSYYFSDDLQTASVITNSAGTITQDEDYYPWGGELPFINGDPNHYKFTGKERDAETGLDYFGARYYSNGLGRFITPDWSATPVPVPYADLTDPQTLNQYSYVRNIPTVKVDTDGHDTNGLDHEVKGFDQRMDQVDAFVVRALNHPAVQAFIMVLTFGELGGAEGGAASGAARGVEEGAAAGAARGAEGAASGAAKGAESGAAKGAEGAAGKAGESSADTIHGAQREAMRQEGIPTSQQPTSQTSTAAGRQYTYTVPKRWRNRN